MSIVSILSWIVRGAGGSLGLPHPVTMTATADMTKALLREDTKSPPRRSSPAPAACTKSESTQQRRYAVRIGRKVGGARDPFPTPSTSASRQNTTHGHADRPRHRSRYFLETPSVH